MNETRQTKYSQNVHMDACVQNALIYTQEVLQYFSNSVYA